MNALRLHQAFDSNASGAIKIEIGQPLVRRTLALMQAFLLAAVLLAPCAFTGCKTTPEDIAFKATDVVAVTATAAMSEWLDYKNTHTVPADQIEKVKVAWNRYYALNDVERKAVIAYKTGNSTNTLSLAISVANAASSDLIKLIVQLLPPERAVKLRGSK